MTTFAVDGSSVAIARSGGRPYAFRYLCGHATCALSPGEIADGQIECHCHGARFDLATGRPTGPPATRPITTCRIEEDGRDALVAITS